MRRLLIGLRQNWLLAAAGLLLAAGCIGLTAGHAQAASMAYGRNLDEQYYDQNGYRDRSNLYYGFVFAKTTDIPYEGVSENWQTQPITVDIFVSEVQKRLNSPNPGNSARASAIINMMLGIGGDDARYNAANAADRWKNGVALAKSNFPTWEGLVRDYAGGKIAGASVNFDDRFNAKDPTDWLGLHEASNDNNQYPDIYYGIVTETYVSEPVITFYNADKTVFRLLKKCANPVGEESPLVKTAAATPPPAPTPPPTPPSKPFFTVKGGDVSAGARFATPGPSAAIPCGTSHVAAAGIAGWNNHADFSGAGIQFGATAYGLIEDAASAQGFGGSPYLLSFTNTANVNPTTGMYGGQFDDSPCIDYWADKPTSNTAVFNGGPVSGLNGNYVKNGPAAKVIISASSIADGNHSTVYIDGDVAITGDIKYANTSWASRQAIPSFKLVVHGTIYIDASVKQLDGSYVAVPDSNFTTTKNEFSAPIPGTITTCAIGGFTSYNPANYLQNRIESACKNQLVVNGSLAANQVWLLRSLGSVDATKIPAEIVNYVPDTWIAPGSGGNSTTIDNGTYQSIIGLPPVL